MTEQKSNIVGEISAAGDVVSGVTHIYQVPIERLSKADPANVQEIAASQIELLGNYHKEVLEQAKKSFNWALIAAGIGLLFFLSAIILLVFFQSKSVAMISGVGGAIIEFISAINFYLYSKTSTQMADFQNRLDKTQRYLIANSLCESLEGNIKNIARAELVRTIAGINMSVSKEKNDSTMELNSLVNDHPSESTKEK